ncbi:MAG: hypothetical protein EOO43_02850 [Flavobacterium sp.]|nr:MAG: hypothetical protein EOO43_02850 [Flavobacterium sp.]
MSDDKTCIECGKWISGKPRYATEFGFMQRGPFCSEGCKRTYVDAKKSKNSNESGTGSFSFVDTAKQDARREADEEATRAKVAALKAEGKNFQAFVHGNYIFIAVGFMALWFIAMILFKKVVDEKDAGGYAFWVVVVAAAVGAYFYAKDFFKKS